MSSNEDGESAGFAKKRKVQRACDSCRKKKTRCEPTEVPGDRCSNCARLGYFKCTFEGTPAPKRGRYQDKEMFERLEMRLGRLEALFHRLHPDMDLDKLLEQDDPHIPPQALSTMSAAPSAASQNPGMGELVSKFIHPVVEVPPAPDDDVVDLRLMANFGKLSINPREEGLFFGKSSGIVLLQSAFDLKQKMTGSPKSDTSDSRILAHRRKEFWSMSSWELRAVLETSSSTSYQFPDADLMPVLIDLYFKHHHPFLPFLHRPTFERSMKEGLHLRDDTFGGIVLLVCANGSRHSDDPRVLLEGTESKLSCGWKWFSQVQVVRKSLLRSPALHDLQFYILAIRFLQGSTVGHASWILVGIALRLAQEVGVHRKRKNAQPRSAQNELWKRGFWALVYMDRSMSSLLGRPSAIGDEDFDLDFPLEVDDEYWEHSDPNQAFKQPPDKPSLVSSFNCTLRLMHILEAGRRILYCSNKSKVYLGLVGEWEKPIVAQLDSLMNNWLDSLPDHLQWDPNRKSDVFFDQSAELYSQYYYVQMVLHRPFLRSSSTLALPSMLICANAARNCANVIYTHSEQAPSSIIPMVAIGAFTSSIALLLHSWSSKRSGLGTNQRKDLADVHKCMQVLRKIEGRWSVAGRLWDIISELANVGDIPLPGTHVARGNDNVNSSIFAPPPEVSTSYLPFSPSANGGPSKPSFITPTPSQFDNSILIDNVGAPPFSSGHLFAGSGASMDDLSTSPPRTVHPIQFSEFQTHDVSPTDRDLYDQFLSGYGGPYPQSMSLDRTSSQPTSLVNDDQPNSATMLPQVMFDNGTMDLWMSAPTGFDLEDWGRYLSNVDDLTHGTVNPHSNPG